MNKTKFKTEIDHTLKAAGHRKSIIKGRGWKGHGTSYRRSGFLVGHNKEGVLVGYYFDSDLPMSMLYRAGTPQAESLLMRIRSQKYDALKKYKAALTAFVTMDMLDDCEMPYILVPYQKRD